jgi:hypothetical protein
MEIILSKKNLSKLFNQSTKDLIDFNIKFNQLIQEKQIYKNIMYPNLLKIKTIINKCHTFHQQNQMKNTEVLGIQLYHIKEIVQLKKISILKKK